MAKVTKKAKKAKKSSKTTKKASKKSEKAYTGRGHSKYKPEYAQELIEHMSSGLSFETFAAVADVCRATLYDWLEAHDDFRAAYAKGKAHCQLAWETMGVKGTLGSIGFNASSWKFNMQNRFGWTDRRDVQVQDITKVPDADLKKRVKEIMGEN